MASNIVVRHKAARTRKHTNEENHNRRREAEVEAEPWIYKTKDSGRQLTTDPDLYRNIP